jgi:hypothetical protein
MSEEADEAVLERIRGRAGPEVAGAPSGAAAIGFFALQHLHGQEGALLRQRPRPDDKKIPLCGSELTGGYGVPSSRPVKVPD